MYSWHYILTSKVHVYDYYKLDDSVDEALPAFCRVEKLPPVYVESDLSCSPEEQNTFSFKPLQVQVGQFSPQIYCHIGCQADH